MNAVGLLVVAIAAYPLLVYGALRWLPLGQGAFALFALYAGALLLRARSRNAQLRKLVGQHLPLLLLIGAAVLLRDRRLLLLLPVLVNLYLLTSFGRTLWRGPPMIERFARIVEDDLPDFTHPYCRKVTKLWCLFFLANATGIAWLALRAPIEWWTLYTGLLFYVVLALFQGGEFVVRKLWFRYYDGGPLDRYFQRFFPADQTANGRRSLAYQAARAAAIRSTDGRAGRC